jgi:hypothetical protein
MALPHEEFVQEARKANPGDGLELQTASLSLSID